MTSEPPDVLPASTFEAHAQEPPDVLPATTFESAPDTLPASHFDAPDVLPASTFEHPSSNFDTAYAAQQRANAAGTGGGSPITPREQKNITDAPKALFKGASKLVLKVAQGAEGAAQPFTNPIGALTGTGRFFTEDRTNKMIAGEDTALPTKQSTRNKILETVGGAIPAVAATTVLGPEAAAPIFTGQGGASGFASAEDQNAADVAAGKPVGGATQELRKAGSTLLGAASGYVGGKLADAAGGLPNAAARVAGQGVVGAATGVAENTGQNIIQGRPALQGTGQAAATGGAMGAGLGLGSEIHRAFVPAPAVPQAETSPSNEGTSPSKPPTSDSSMSQPASSEPPDTLPPEVFEGKANAAQPATAAIQAERVPATPEAAQPTISPSGGMEKPVETAGTAPGTAKSGEVPLVGQAPKELPTSSNLPSGASISEPTPPTVAGQGESTGEQIREAFATGKNAATDGFVDSMWKRVQDGTPIERLGPLENQLRESQKAGTIQNRDDVARIVSDYAQPKAQAPPPAGGESGQGKVGSAEQSFSAASADDPTLKYGTGESVTSIKNAQVDKERASRGQEPMMAPIRQADQGVWDQAMSKIDKNPSAATDLVSDLNRTPRPISDVEDAVLLHHRVDLTNQRDGNAIALQQAQDAGDQAGVSEHRVERDRIENQMQQLENASKSAGTQTARGLRFRQKLAQEDFTLAGMEQQKRTANDGKPLTEDQYTQVKATSDKIKTAQKALDQYKARTEAAKEKALATQIAALEARIKAGDISVKGGTPTVESKQMTNLKAKRDALNEQLAAMRGDQTAQKAFKTRTGKRIEELQGKIDTGDFTTGGGQKQELKLDPEGERLKAQLERYKQIFQEGLIRDRLKNRTPLEKTQDALVRWRRAFLLSNPITLAKLTSAAAERIGITPAEEAVGGAIGKAFPGVANKANIQGGLSIKAEARALTQGFTKGMSDAAQTLRTGKSDLDTLYGKNTPLPRHITDYIGSLHGALKAPAKRAAFERAFQKGAESAIQSGLDPHDPMVQTRLSVDAYKEAQRSIFMQDNRVVNAWKRGIAALRQPDAATGKTPAWSRALATTGDVLLPIVKVPTNIVGETIESATGLVTGSARLGLAYARGIETLQPDEANLIMRQLKKGSLGAAVMALGYFARDKIGGYYQPGQKRDAKDVKFGAVRVFGHDIPSYLTHNPLLEMLQFGATIGRVADSFRTKADRLAGAKQGLTKGTLAAALGVVQEVPFVRETEEIGKGLDPRTQDSAVGNMAKSLAVPQLVQSVAEAGDRDASGEVVQRAPKGILQNIQSGIPGLRNQLPVKKKR